MTGPVRWHLNDYRGRMVSCRTLKTFLPHGHAAVTKHCELTAPCLVGLHSAGRMGRIRSVDGPSQPAHARRISVCRTTWNGGSSMKKTALWCAGLMAALPLSAHAATEISWWHAMTCA